MLNSILAEDIGYCDITTNGLGIGHKDGTMTYSPKSQIILSGCEYVTNMLQELNLSYTFYKQDGDIVMPNETILIVQGIATKLHKLWKISQNTIEYMSAIATYTNHLITKAKAINPNIIVSTTRKNMPTAKELMIRAVVDGGGVIHRLGLYDSILIFEQHLVFLQDTSTLLQSIKNLKYKYIEKKIAIEVSNYDNAKYFASLGIDILQCEKMDTQTLSKCVALKQDYPYLLVSATGNINIDNIDLFVECGVDFIVTSSPYHAKPIDIRVSMQCIDN